MATLHPDLSEHQLSIRDHMQDLMTPFSRSLLYAGDGGERVNQEDVSGAFPGDPSLDYHALRGVHNGSGAATAFQHLTELPLEEQEERREQLLRYCELDTLATARIWEKLMKVVEGE